MFKRFKSSKVDNLLIVMLVSAVIALFGSFVLSVETVNHLKNPNAELSCSVSPLVNCATVMDSWQAEMFGFPNIFVGLMGFSVLVTLIVVAMSGVKLPKWIMACMELAIILATLFLFWLMYSSIFVIQVLCLWCALIAFSTIILLAAATRWSLRERAFNFSKKTDKKLQKWLDSSYDILLFAGIFASLALVLLAKYVFELF